MKCFRPAATVLLLTFAMSASGCHLRRPGEYQPRVPTGCDPQRITALEGRLDTLTEAERDVLEYCRLALASEALQAQREHVDYIADLQYFGILLSVVAVILTAIAESSD